jgi:hypothetical protein
MSTFTTWSLEIGATVIVLGTQLVEAHGFCTKRLNVVAVLTVTAESANVAFNVIE